MCSQNEDAAHWVVGARCGGKELPLGTRFERITCCYPSKKATHASDILDRVVRVGVYGCRVAGRIRWWR